MSTNPQVQNLELQAMEQRNQLHKSVAELRRKVTDVREKLDIKRNIRDHVMASALMIAAILVIATIPVARSFDR